MPNTTLPQKLPQYFAMSHFTFQNNQKLSRLSGNFPEFPKTFPNIWIFSRESWNCPVSGYFPEYLESFQSVRKQSAWKLFRVSVNFPECAKIFKNIPKLSRVSGNFQECLQTFNSVWKLFRVSGNFQSLQNLSRLSGKFPEYMGIFTTVPKLSTVSGKFPEYP